MYVPILFLTIVLLVIFYGFLYLTYLRNNKSLEKINNII